MDKIFELFCLKVDISIIWI